MTAAEFIIVLSIGAMAAMAITVAAFARARRRRELFVFSLACAVGAIYGAVILIHIRGVAPNLDITLATRCGYLSACGYISLKVEFLARHGRLRLGWPERVFGFGAPAVAAVLTLVPRAMFVPGAERNFSALGAVWRAPIPATGALVCMAMVASGLLVVVHLAYRLRHTFFSGVTIVTSLVLLLVAGSADMVTTLGVIDFPYLGQVAGVGVSLALAAQLASEWGDEATQLISLRRSLEQGLGSRSEELEEARSALAHQDRLTEVGRVAASVGHEINNPLTYVKANLELLQSELTDDDEQRELVSEALEGVDRIGYIVRDLRQLSRRGDAELAPVDLAQAMGAVVRTLRHRLTTNRRIEVDIPTGLYVQAEATGLTQIFINLVSNALDALADDDEAHVISVGARIDGNRVEVSVADDGPGLPPEIRDRVFEPFASASKEGMGLGLTIVKNLVDAFGGSVEAACRPEGGTQFTVRLARRVPSRVGPSSSKEDLEDARLAGMRILVVDDQPEVGRAVRRFLKPAQVVSVMSGFAAVEVVEEEPVDLVICDVMMPGMSGLDVWEQLQSRPSGAPPFLFMTGGAPTHGLEESLAASGVPVLYKPFSREEVLRAFDQLRPRRSSKAAS